MVVPVAVPTAIAAAITIATAVSAIVAEPHAITRAGPVAVARLRRIPIPIALTGIRIGVHATGQQFCQDRCRSILRSVDIFTLSIGRLWPSGGDVRRYLTVLKGRPRNT